MPKASTPFKYLATKCVLCTRHLHELFGHNPAPVKNFGRCCTFCNETRVIPARVKALVNGDKTRLVRQPVNVPVNASVVPDSKEEPPSSEVCVFFLFFVARILSCSSVFFSGFNCF